MKEFVIYGMGLCYASVCSSLPLKEVKERIRSELCGTRHGWRLDKKPFADGIPNPTPCNDAPKTHKHYLFSC